MYYVMRASAPSLHRESTDSLISTDVSSAGARLDTGHSSPVCAIVYIPNMNQLVRNVIIIITIYSTYFMCMYR